MNIRIVISILFWMLVSFLLCDTCYAQEDTIVHSDLKIVNADSLEFRGDLDPIETHYKGNVRMTHDSIYMFSDTSIISETQMVANGISIIQSDTIVVFADSMAYNIENYTAELYYNVVLENGLEQLFTDRLDYDLNSKIAVFPDTVLLSNERTKINSLRGKYDVEAKLATFVHQVIVEDEEFNLTTDSLLFNTAINKAIFVAPTNIRMENEIVYCESGFYNLGTGKALFEGNALYKSDGKVATADEMTYNSSSKMITLIGNANYSDKELEAKGDKIVYNEQTKDINISGNAWVNKDGSVVVGDAISYNEKSEEMEIEGGASIDSEENQINSDGLRKDKDSGNIIFYGNAEWLNKEDSTMVYGDEIIVSEEEERYVAIGHDTKPFMKRPMDGDSLILSADSLIFEQQIDSLDTFQVFKAVHDVKILSDKFQALSDSLYYDSKDSTFVLTKNPIMWSDSSQYVGDTINLKMVDNKIESIELLQNAFIIEWIEDTYYNQIKAKYLHAFLDSNEIKKMHLENNAESNYYILDDESAYVGLNHTLCKSMDFYFNGGDLEDIKFYFEPTSLLTPIQQLQPDKLYLEGFDWKDELKPKTLEDLIFKPVKAEVNLPNESTDVDDDIKKEEQEPKSKLTGQEKQNDRKKGN